MYLNFLQAQGASNPQGGSMMPMLIMLVAMFAIMYFFMIRPQKKRQKELQQWRSSIEPGTKVVIGGGILGTVKDTNQGESYLSIEIAKGVIIKVDRSMVFADIEQTMQK